MKKEISNRRNMRPLILAVGTIAILAVTNASAVAQPTEEITVTAPRTMGNNVGMTPSGVPIKEMSVAYDVSYADLDLTKVSGVTELDRRIDTMAKQACSGLDKLNPLEARDRSCVSKAINSAAVQRKRALAIASAK